MNINQRIRSLRKNLKLNQKDFGIALGMGQAAISWMEQDNNTIIDKNKRIICDKFHVSMHWLETGEGEMYAPNTPADIFDAMRNELHLSSIEEKILRGYFELDGQSRKAVTNFIVNIGKSVIDDPSISVEPATRKIDTDTKRSIVNTELDDEAKGKTS